LAGAAAGRAVLACLGCELAGETGMDGAIQALLRHEYVILFVWVLLEQAGLPVPAVPVLLGVGALAGHGRMSLAAALCLAVVASLPADLAWFELGRRRGTRVLSVLCRVSLEPDSCVRRTENLFVRQGPRALLIAKFLPGLSTVAPPLAGIVRMGRGRFALLDGLGAVLWAGFWIALGYVSSDGIELVAAQAARLGDWLLALIGGILGVYIFAKYLERRHFLRTLRKARILPEDLKRRLDAGEDLVIIDVRSPLDLDAIPHAIPGARWIAAEDIGRRRAEIPSDREIVVYCA
jgi:membrane protein DedA with SNARE-associated domain